VGIVRQRTPHAFRVMRDHAKIGPGGAVGLGSPLFPIAQRADGNVVLCGKLLLREREGAANDLRPWRPSEAAQVGTRQRLSVGVGARPFRFAMASSFERRQRSSRKYSSCSILVADLAEMIRVRSSRSVKTKASMSAQALLRLDTNAKYVYTYIHANPSYRVK